MSLSKIIIIVIVSGIGLFILLLVYTLWPAVRNVSDHKAIKRFVSQPLKLKREASIYFCKPGGYRFVEHVLSEENPISSEKKYDLPVGSVITIQKFKTYKSNAGAGLTDLYALCEWINVHNEKTEFEYYWGGTDPSFYLKESAVLPMALWQEHTDELIRYEEE